MPGELEAALPHMRIGPDGRANRIWWPRAADGRHEAWPRVAVISPKDER